MIVQLKDINKSYGLGEYEVKVLKNINLAIDKGEYVSIMGPSGSGKSTLMNILGCLDRPTSGQYFLDGSDVAKLNDGQLSRARLTKIGFIFQSFHLLPRSTALENVALPLVYSKTPKLKRAGIATQALAAVGLEERLHFLPNQLSGGQKQRVAIARAMINHPLILLADEPTGALDQASGRQVLDLFDELNAKGATIITITHDRNVALRAKRVLNMIDGELFEEQEAIHETD